MPKIPLLRSSRAWAVLGCLLAQAVAAKIVCVAPAGNDGNTGLSWDAARKSISAGLAVAAAGDEVWVAEGTYRERVSIPKDVALYGGFAGRETARDQRNWALHPTILDGGQAGAVVKFEVAGTSSVGRLDGVTVRNGRGIMGGGIVCIGSAPVIANCFITQNTSVGEGGGICCYNGANPLILNNQITENYASDSEGDGGGICAMAGDEPSNLGSSPWIVGNVIARNRASQTGGGVASKHAYMSPDKSIYIPSAPVILNNFIYFNMASENEVGLGGGGLSCITNGTVKLLANNTFLANAGLQAGGVLLYVGARDNPLVVNNTFIANNGPALRWGGGHPLLLANNLVAFNSAGFVRWLQIPGDAYTLSHNCVYGNGVDYDGIPDPTGTLGNISLDPHLASRAFGNSHLQPDSPCIDAGDNTVLSADWTDADGQPRVLGGGVDIGADESDGTVWNVATRVVRVSPDGNDNNTGAAWNVAKRTLGAALTALYTSAIGVGHAAQGGEVWVKGGTYPENLTLPPHLYLYGGFSGNEAARDQRNPKASETIIDGHQNGRVVLALSGYRVSAVDGFTIANGRLATQMTDQGGGVECYHSGVIVANNVIKQNVATAGGGVGGFGCTALIQNNQILNNSAGGDGNGWGGGMHFDRSLPVIEDNVISGNKASDGGGIYTSFCKPWIIHNDIGKNTGNGIKCITSRGLDWITTREMLISRNAIYGHLTSDQGGGIYIMFCAGRIENNLVVQNQVGTLSGGSVGGGMSLMGGDENDGPLIVANNCVLGNKAEYFGLSCGGGISTSLLRLPSTILVNNIVAYNNTGVFNAKSSPVSPVMIHNDVWNNGGADYELVYSYGLSGGPLNHPTDISVDPQFVNLTDNFSLQPGSPCIDAGSLEYAGVLDFDGLPRGLVGKNTVLALPDIGAFEYVNPSAHGTLAFSSPNYQADQSQGTAELALVRTVGVGGSVSVQYSTSDGTARAGVDYVATNGVITLANQQASALIRVPLLRPGSPGSNLTVNIVLTNPTGGATLGPNSQAVLTITRVGGTVSIIPTTPQVAIVRSGSSLTVTWRGTLQSADILRGPWSDVPNANSPLTLVRVQGTRFYRAR